MMGLGDNAPPPADFPALTDPPDPQTYARGQWEQLRAFIETTFGEGFVGNSDFVFRGEPACYPTVFPLIDRLLPEDQCVGGLGSRLIAESQAMLRFRQHAPMHLDQIQRDHLGKGMLAQTVMRHYGAPTRLLDWTESPWIALFFACEDVSEPPLPQGRATGRILAFDRKALEVFVATHFSEESKVHARFIQNQDGWVIPDMVTLNFAREAKDWVACYHLHQEKFPRLTVQQGLFTIASKPWLDHWKLAAGRTVGRCYEIRIEPGLKFTAMKHLFRMGITAAALFPGVEGVAREVRAYARFIQGLER